MFHTTITQSIWNRFWGMTITDKVVATKVDDTTYLLQYEADKERQYYVDTEIGICSCPVGLCGAPCKHQAYVAKDSFHKPCPS